MRTTNLMLSFALVASMFAGVAGSAPEALAKNNNRKVTICHATASTKNPFVKITVDYNSIVKQGHDQHQDDRDIIPALPEHSYPGKNLQLMSTLENGCKTPKEVVEPSQPNKPEQPTKPTQPEKPATPSKPDKKQHKYTICHATRSATNPYRVITVDYNSIIKQGHGSHDDLAVSSYAQARSVKAAGGHWGDVIPAIPEHDYLGKNNDKAGRQLLANDCNFKADNPVEVTAPVVEDEPKSTPTPGRGSIVAAEKVPETKEQINQTTVDSLPVTGIVSSPLLILMIGMLTAGASYLVTHLRRSVTE